ncbi:LOW QUALITY PROTEIN: Zeta-crystallin [Galemys pyrenaicus]|uniref:Zeta-crystallin n=1 Tax=Galemys pyrenaicus TaxID=202257 RepID=A0A8J6ANQ5_GALPY|nr:LOW QUALITY PROTEIN: Zeta-crystallin [Galemys pyrenaicus]
MVIKAVSKAHSLVGCAEYVLAANYTVYTMSENLDFNQGASIRIPYFTVYRAVSQRLCKAEESILDRGEYWGSWASSMPNHWSYGRKKSVGEKGINVVTEMLASVHFNKDLDLLSYGRLLLAAEVLSEIIPWDIMVKKSSVLEFLSVHQPSRNFSNLQQLFMLEWKLVGWDCNRSSLFIAEGGSSSGKSDSWLWGYWKKILLL